MQAVPGRVLAEVGMAVVLLGAVQDALAQGRAQEAGARQSGIGGIMRWNLGLAVLACLCGCERHKSDPVPSTPAPTSHMNLLVMGQSNAVRFSPDGALVFQSSYPSATVTNCAVNGTGIDLWASGGALFQNCVADGAVDAIFFYQGEQDAMALDTASSWAQKFTAIVRALQLRYPGVPIVFAQLDGTTRPNFLAYWSVVQDQQASVSMPGVRMIRTSDIPYDGDLHLPPAGEQELARRLVVLVSFEN